MLNRKIIGIFGKTNSGKSSLLNALTGQGVSIVSEVSGTTTDIVSKIMELLPVGSVQILDTAGLDDRSELGFQRVEKSLQAQSRADLALLVCDASSVDEAFLAEQTKRLDGLNTSVLLVFSKIDRLDDVDRRALMGRFPQALFTSVSDPLSIDTLRSAMIDRLSKGEGEKPLIGDLVPSGKKVVLVCPIDSEAPKGRLILPQVQVLRDCLDHGIISLVLGVGELEKAIDCSSDIHLVVTDSQAFKEVNELIKGTIPLTSFSVLLARQKGDFETLLRGALALEMLSEGSRVLIAETCSHNTSHEDIGRVKLPMLLRKACGSGLDFSFATGLDFPSDLSSYDLVIHCGGCMINSKLMSQRIRTSLEHGVSITNYGLALAWLTGILKQSVEPLGYTIEGNEICIKRR